MTLQDKKKILVIGPGMEIGGVERSLIGLLDNFDYSKVDVDLFLFSRHGELLSHINPNAHLLPEQKCFSLINYSIARLFCRGHFLIGMFRLMAMFTWWLHLKFSLGETSFSNHITLCKKWATKLSFPLVKDYDLALGFFGPHYFLEQKVKAKNKIGWVHTDYGHANEKPDKTFILPMWAGLDYIACVSESVKGSFDAVFPELKNKTIVIENILSTELVRQQAKQEQEKVLQEMPNDGAFRLLTVGRFSPPKNYPAAIDACKALHDKGMNIKWYFLGYGPMDGEIKNRIHEQNAEDYVKVLGKRENPYPYIAKCDLYVQPSLYEGKAVTVREAQILGKPVLITDFATASAQLEHGVDGYICPLSPEGIVSGIEFLFSHADYRNQLAGNALSRDYSNLSEMDKIYRFLS